MMRGALRYWHTVRYLRPVQLYGRVAFLLSRPRVDSAPAPPLRALRACSWAVPARRVPSLVAPERFRFLGETHELSETGWEAPSLSRLWRYNLHYFNDLSADGAPDRAGWHRALLRRWVSENPPGSGTGWEPYPTSLRIVNWIKWALAGNVLSPECVQSLAVQARWLSGRVEQHLLGNHLLSNGKALLFAGLFFDGPEAASWLAGGLRIIAQEMPEQVLPDGGHFERSTMYHALALEDLLDVENIVGAYVDADESGVALRKAAGGVRARTPSMRRWLATMCHPDGEISYFNDAAAGIAPTPAELERYAVRLASPHMERLTSHVHHLAASGYVRVERDHLVAILDVGDVGPDYLPAHAHADTLSFEMSLAGQRVFVNSGTSRYGEGPERLAERGTAAHNTVVVDGTDSSEVWGGFRVARRARPREMRIEPSERGVTVHCAHDGYRRLPGKVIHSRTWTFGRCSLMVRDQIAGTFSEAEARLHLHPAIRVRAIREGVNGDAVLSLPRGEEVRIVVTGGLLRAEPAAWHPGFGLTERTTCLSVRFRSTTVHTEITWSENA